MSHLISLQDEINALEQDIVGFQEQIETEGSLLPTLRWQLAQAGSLLRRSQLHRMIARIEAAIQRLRQEISNHQNEIKDIRDRLVMSLQRGR